MEGPYFPANITKISAFAQACATFIGFQRDTQVINMLHNLAFKNLLLLVQILMVFKIYPG